MGTELDKVKAFYTSKAGLGARIGHGKKTAVIVIDMQYGLTDPDSPLYNPSDECIENINKVIHESRPKEVLVVFVRTAFEEHLLDGGMFVRKIPSLAVLKLRTRAVELDGRLDYQEGDPIVTKEHTSAFFETNLNSMLRFHGIDTLIITGCSTSGCVRAACMDAVSHGYYSMVPRECVTDRAQLPHEYNLFDIDAKYSDVMSMDEVLRYLRELPEQSRA